MNKKGTIVLMGSGELTATMVEVHKEMIARQGKNARAVFLDTPAGFQLNVDEISLRAADYFRTRVQHPLEIASFKSVDVSPYEAEQAFHTLRHADFTLIGPGSPTYAVRHLKQSPAPDILFQLVEKGGCLTAASAAALTLGAFTLPVYEIYKVGHPVHWVDGLDTLGCFGLRLAVIPHWNNAEGGTHDTRFCFMGESRFQALTALLPEDVTVLGLDEHTACILDFSTGTAEVRGIGQVVIRRKEKEICFAKGDRFPLSLLGEGDTHGEWQALETEAAQTSAEIPVQDGFWDKIHTCEKSFQKGLETQNSKISANALLEMDRLIWQAKQDLESEESVIQARDVFRESIVLLEAAHNGASLPTDEMLSTILNKLLALRAAFRQQKKWAEADMLRDHLNQAGIAVEDTPEGPRWHMESDGKET